MAKTKVHVNAHKTAKPRKESGLNKSVIKM